MRSRKYADHPTIGYRPNAAFLTIIECQKKNVKGYVVVVNAEKGMFPEYLRVAPCKKKGPKKGYSGAEKNLVRDFLKTRYHFSKSRYRNFGSRQHHLKNGCAPFTDRHL